MMSDLLAAALYIVFVLLISLMMPVLVAIGVKTQWPALPRPLGILLSLILTYMAFAIIRHIVDHHGTLA
jgi:hypothetical protein